MNQMYIFNGSFSKSLPIVPINRATYYGESFFTSFVVQDKSVCGIDAHFHRLQSSLNLFYPELEKINQQEIINLLREHVPEKGRFKVRLTCFTNFEIDTRYDLIEIKKVEVLDTCGLKLISKKFGNYSEIDLKNLKLGQYAWENLYLKNNPGFDILRLSDDDLVHDLTKSNVLFFDGTNFVAPLANVLQGTSLKLFREFHKKKFIQREIYYDEICEFESVFSINAVRLLQIVTQIDGKKFANKNSDKYIRTFREYVDRVSKTL